ncbi:MAG: hypothetical protein DRI61_12535 [Chloroflexi bacterium]|nr:MAG: hypothetical protein DRI61_12535 [Chloroflexota bacterium]
MELHSNGDVDVHLDDNDNDDAEFRVLNGANTTVFTVTESGAVSWAAQTGYVSVPAAAFRPQADGYDFTNFGNRLINNNDISDFYNAPVQLPHGATVTKMTFYWYDTSSDNGSVVLRRCSGSSCKEMAEVDTSGSSGDGSSDTSSISYNPIDNSQYTYFLHLDLPDSDVNAYFVVIEYTYTGPH